uniref:Putative secreted protein n=1 Tax=Anopheles marajoara TaxID=58244 RepID=A0A2M4C9P8_9DIPT
MLVLLHDFLLLLLHIVALHKFRCIRSDPCKHECYNGSVLCVGMLLLRAGERTSNALGMMIIDHSFAPVSRAELDFNGDAYYLHFIPGVYTG